MRILFTGGSSFTGYWFVKEMVAAGHEVIATFQHQIDEYSGLRRHRVDVLAGLCRAIFGVSFGDETFIALIKENRCDLLCHHGADVTNYKSPDFDIASAVAKTTRGLPVVLDTLLKSGSDKILLTGSVFENDEGAGSDDLRAFSPYGLSKAFTWQAFRYHAQLREMVLGKFVIANPFGPYEEPRFVNYLMKNWFAGKPAIVNTPLYVRDNIHISLLAKCYLQYALSLPNSVTRLNPSGYIETQGSFTQRVASEMQKRLGLQCAIELRMQTDFPEPLTRINKDRCDVQKLNWSEAVAWDGLAEYYTGLMTAR
jgi:UDP-glucose 4-epimerase